MSVEEGNILETQLNVTQWNTKPQLTPTSKIIINISLIVSIKLTTNTGFIAGLMHWITLDYTHVPNKHAFMVSPKTSGGSVWKPSGCCPCSMSNKACRLRRHSEGWENRVSFISSNTPHRPMPMICRDTKRIFHELKTQKTARLTVMQLHSKWIHNILYWH